MVSQRREELSDELPYSFVVVGWNRLIFQYKLLEEGAYPGLHGSVVGVVLDGGVLWRFVLDVENGSVEVLEGNVRHVPIAMHQSNELRGV